MANVINASRNGKERPRQGDREGAGTAECYLLWQNQLPWRVTHQMAEGTAGCPPGYGVGLCLVWDGLVSRVRNGN